MTIDKAIETLTIAPGQSSYFLTQERRNALAIGIEALERVKEARKKVYFTARRRLPGETKE